MNPIIKDWLEDAESEELHGRSDWNGVYYSSLILRKNEDGSYHYTIGRVSAKREWTCTSYEVYINLERLEKRLNRLTKKYYYTFY